MFQPVELVWKDKTYTIPANKVLGAIASVEAVLTLGELQGFAVRNSAPIAKMSMAYGALLRYAGASVNDGEIAEHVFVRGDTGAAIITAIANLLQLMIPQHVRDATAAAAAAGAGTPDEGNA